MKRVSLAIALLCSTVAVAQAPQSQLPVKPSGVMGRITAVSAKKQRELAQAIKRARFLGLLPYVIR